MRNPFVCLLIAVLAGAGCQGTMPTMSESAVDKELSGAKPKPPLPESAAVEDEPRPGFEQEPTISQNP